jgi:hypothetical protein
MALPESRISYTATQLPNCAGYVMFTAIALFVLIFAVGFAAGYSLRSYISRRRHWRRQGL